MLWALLIALLITKLSGGPEEIFMIDNLDKEIKSHVVDKDRKKEILLVAKQAKKEIKTFGKLRSKKLKQIRTLGKSKEVSSEELWEIYSGYHDARIDLQSVLIDKRLRIQTLMEDDEWKQLIVNSVLPSEKAQKKTEKGDLKQDEKLSGLIRKVDDAIAKEISDPERRKNLQSNFEKFAMTLNEFVSESKSMNFKDNKLVRNKYCSREDLEKFYEKQNELRLKGTKEYFQLRDAAIKITSDDEWNKIIKAINTITKS